jgi:hypothetical protein
LSRLYLPPPSSAAPPSQIPLISQGPPLLIIVALSRSKSPLAPAHLVSLGSPCSSPCSSYATLTLLQLRGSPRSSTHSHTSLQLRGSPRSSPRSLTLLLTSLALATTLPTSRSTRSRDDLALAPQPRRRHALTLQPRRPRARNAAAPTTHGSSSSVNPTSSINRPASSLSRPSSRPLPCSLLPCPSLRNLTISPRADPLRP